MINLKEDWLDNVTEEQLRGFFEHSKLAKIKELRSVKIIQDDEGNKRVFFNYDAYSRTMDTNEIAVFDAFGQITPYQRQYHDARTVKDLDSIVNDEDLINWHLMVSSANRGRVIDGKTYNINNCITNQLKMDGEWMYSYDTTKSTRRVMTGGETLSVLDTVTFSKTFVDGIQGKYFKLFLYIEGSPLSDFSM